MAARLIEVLGRLGVVGRTCSTGAEALAWTDREAAHALVGELELLCMSPV